MTKSNILYAAVLILIALNLALMSMMFMGKQKGHHPPLPHAEQRQNPRSMIIEKLDFTPDQVDKFEELIDLHKMEVNNVHKKIVKTKRDLYETLATDDYSQQDSLTMAISGFQAEIENIHFNHFKSIKALCTDEQTSKFNDFSKELSRVFAPSPPKRGH